MLRLSVAERGMRTIAHTSHHERRVRHRLRSPLVCLIVIVIIVTIITIIAIIFVVVIVILDLKAVQ